MTNVEPSFSRNRHFMDTDKVFRKACELAGTPPTQRQASKYTKGRGKAFPFKNLAVMSLEQDGVK